GQEGDAADEAAVPGRLGPLRLPDHGEQRREYRRGADDAAPGGVLVCLVRPAEQHGREAFRHVGAREHALRHRGIDVDQHEGADREARRRGAGRRDEPHGRDPRRRLRPIRPAKLCEEAIMDYDGMRELKSSFGTACRIVMDQSTDVIKAVWRLSKFFKHESCGQCTPCREGTGWMMRVMERLVRGDAEVEEIDMLFDVTKQVEGHTICALGDAAAWPSQGLSRHYREEIEDRIKAKKTGRMGAMAAE